MLKMGRWIPKGCNPFPFGPRWTNHPARPRQGAPEEPTGMRRVHVLLESRRNGSDRTVALQSGGWRRSVCFAAAPNHGAAALGTGPRRRCGDEAPIHGEAGGRIGWRGHRDITLPVSVHGRATPGSGRARRVDGHGRGCGASGCGGSSRLAVVGWRQVHGWTDDFPGCGTASTGGRAGIGVLWLSTAPAQPAGNETSRPPCEGCNTDALPAGNARYACRSHVVTPRVYEAGLASDVARH